MQKCNIGGVGCMGVQDLGNPLESHAAMLQTWKRTFFYVCFVPNMLSNLLAIKHDDPLIIGMSQLFRAPILSPALIGSLIAFFD